MPRTGVHAYPDPEFDIRRVFDDEVGHARQEVQGHEPDLGRVPVTVADGEPRYGLNSVYTFNKS